MKSPLKNSKRAFTLIELLVVIAIIEILAAILFPVFAQAKEAAKTTTTISNAKQAGTSMMIYLGDYDDLRPTSTIRDLAGVSLPSFTNNVPADWELTNPLDVARHSVGFGNSLQPYMKNFQLYEVAGGLLCDPFPTATPLKQPALVSLGFNGLLQSYSSTAVGEVSKISDGSVSKWKAKCAWSGY